MNANQRRKLEKQRDYDAANRYFAVTFLTMHRIYHWDVDKYQVAEAGVRRILNHDSKRGVQEFGVIKFCEEETGLNLHELWPGISSLYMELYGSFLVSVMANYSYSKKALEIIARGFMKYHKSHKSTDMLLQEVGQFAEIEIK